MPQSSFSDNCLAWSEEESIVHDVSTHVTSACAEAWGRAIRGGRGSLRAPCKADGNRHPALPGHCW